MGGRGSGGRRSGSGRKPQDRAIGPRGVVLPGPGAAPPVSTAPTVEPPADWRTAPAQLVTVTTQLAFLQQAPGPGDPNPQIAELEARVAGLQALVQALAVWHELAPQARERRTLTPATAAHFAMLCRAVVQERATNVPDADHRGLMHRVSTWMKDFCLSPFGKPLVEATPAAAVVSKWAGALK